MHRSLRIVPLLVLCWCAGAAAQDSAAVRGARDDYIRAGAYERASARDSAVSAYLRVIRAAPAHPYADSASARLKALSASGADTALADPYAPALRLKELGFHGAAVEKVKAVADEHPGAPVPREARELLADSLAWWPAALRWSNARLRPFVEAGLVALLALWLLWSLLLLRFAAPRVELATVDAAGVGQPSGASFTAMVQQRVAQLTRGASARGGAAGEPNVVHGPVDGLPFPGMVQSALPGPWAWLQALPTLLAWLSGRPRLEVKAQLHRAGPRGLGLTIALMRRNVPVASHTLWAAEHGGPGGADSVLDDALALAEAAAVWLIFHAPGRRPVPWRRAAPDEPRVGTRDWLSYALFRAGVRATEKDPAAAARLFRRALERDPRNRGARVNLGTLLVEKEEIGRGIAMLERARDECVDGWRDSVLYPALYRLAVARYHVGDAVGAEREARRLVDTIATVLAEARGPADEDWRVYAESIEVQARVLHVGAWAKTTGSTELLARLAEDLDRLGTRTDSANAFYNLACSYWIVACNGRSPGALRDACRNRLVDFLERACEASPSFARQIGKDPALAGVLEDRAVRARVGEIIEEFTPLADPPPKAPPEPAPRVIKLLVGEIAPPSPDPQPQPTAPPG